MFVNWQMREISLKIVYYGPALSGKTTNLQHIYAKTSPKMRNELVSLKTRGDRTIYFDFLQLQLGNIAGLKPRFSLYTVPGQVYYANTRKLVLQGVDGVVFVADSQPHRLRDNAESLRDLYVNLKELEFDPDEIPTLLQCNKQDLDGAMSPQLLQRQLRLNGTGCFPAIAVQGNGVFDTLKAIINRVVAEVQGRF